MAPSPPLDMVTLIGMWTATLLYGANIIVCTECVYVLLRRHEGGTVNRTLLATTIFLFALSTLHISFGLRALIEGFIYAPAQNIPNASIIYFSKEWNRWDTTKNILYCINVMTQDIVLIWRLYVVWGRNWKIIVVPVIFELVHTGTGFITPVLFMNPNISIFNPTARMWAIIPWTMELAVNVVSTVLISLRLMWQDRKMSQVNVERMGYTATLFTIVESGAVFTSLTVAIVGLYLSKNPSFIGAIDVSTQMATLSPTMIIVRVGLGMMHGARKNVNTTGTTARTLGFHNSSFPDPLHIHVTQVEETMDSRGTFAYAMEDIKATKARGGQV
ncbi:hypothetical protein JB92DRAFT_2841261 [Gautieria morchelliformis]|nr:hypothetical protein JB92DRAFT_2841261 [Gautieria morchelliformis]